MRQDDLIYRFIQKYIQLVTVVTDRFLHLLKVLRVCSSCGKNVTLFVHVHSCTRVHVYHGGVRGRASDSLRPSAHVTALVHAKAPCNPPPQQQEAGNDPLSGDLKDR